MRNLKYQFLPVALLFVCVLFSSCETDSINEETNLGTNNELMQNKAATNSSLYYCSEQSGTYQSETYVRHGVYLNPFYIPSPNPFPVKFASWMVDMQTWLQHDFDDANASGSNSTSVDVQFEIDGDGGTGYLNATDGDRLYNEFVCRMMNELSISSASELDNYEFNLEITVDYYLCGCAMTVAYGIAYYD